MTKIQIYDYDCEACGKTCMAELDIKTGVYTCLGCLNQSNEDLGEELE